MNETTLLRSKPKVGLPELADVRRQVQGWLDEKGEPTYVEALRACAALREMIGSFSRTSKVLAEFQPADRRKEVRIRADQALRQAQLQDRPGLSATTLSRMLAQTLLDMMDLCTSLRRSM